MTYLPGSYSPSLVSISDESINMNLLDLRYSLFILQIINKNYFAGVSSIGYFCLIDNARYSNFQSDRWRFCFLTLDHFLPPGIAYTTGEALSESQITPPHRLFIMYSNFVISGCPLVRSNKLSTGRSIIHYRYIVTINKGMCAAAQ